MRTYYSRLSCRAYSLPLSIAICTPLSCHKLIKACNESIGTCSSGLISGSDPTYCAHRTLASSSNSVRCSSMAPSMIWKALIKLLKMTLLQFFRSCLLKPPACISRICFRTVDLPLSPAPTPPKSAVYVLQVANFVTCRRPYLAAKASLPAPASSYHSAVSSQSHRSSSWTRVVQFSFQSTLLLVP
jgi:hypothetical protein